MDFNTDKLHAIAAAQGVSLDPAVLANAQTRQSFVGRHKWGVECYDKDGNLKWTDTFKNIVVNEGLDDILTQYWTGSGYTASFFVGLTDGTPTVAAGDTLDSHAGWVEITAYLMSPDVKPTLTLGAVASQSVDNSASVAAFSITGTATVGGAFITTDNSRLIGSPLGGILVAAGAFTGGDRAVANGDTLNVTVTLTASSS